MLLELSVANRNLYGAYYRNLVDSQGRPQYFILKLCYPVQVTIVPFFLKNSFGLTTEP